MDVEILIHGVPDGQDYDGIAEARTYAELFYDDSTESVKFVVETKTSGNKAYIYYSYVLYKGIVGFGGRSGSYFGLTLRLDKYYQDVIHMYNMLEMVFKKYVVGVLLAPLTESYKYTTPNFASKKTEIEHLHQGLAQLIQETCDWSKFVEIDENFIHPDAATASGNIWDITDESMTTALKKYSKIVLSPDYKLSIAKEYEKKIQEAKEKGRDLVAEKEKALVEKKNELAEKEKSLTAKEETIDKLNAKINSQNNEILILKKEVEQKERENSQNQKNIQLSQKISELKEPIFSLAEYFRVRDSKSDFGKNTPKPSFGHKIFIVAIATCVMSFVIIVLLLFGLSRIGNANNTGNAKALENQIIQLQKTNLQLTKEIESKDETIADLNEQLGGGVKGKEPQTTDKKSPKDEVSFQIISSPSNLSEVVVGQEYIFSVSGYEGKGKWRLDGFDTNDDKSNQKIKVTANANCSKKGHAIITYRAEGGKTAKKAFKIKANE